MKPWLEAENLPKKGSRIKTAWVICPEKKCVFSDCPHTKKHRKNYSCTRDQRDDCPSCKPVEVVE